MDDLRINQLCALLTKADISCGYIPNEPIVKPRDEIVKERLTLYKTMLTDIRQQVANEDDSLTAEQVFKYLSVSVSLVQGDIESQYISINPVLYDRDAMIKDRLIDHYRQLTKLI